MTKRGLVGAWCPSLGATGFRLIDRSGRGNHGTLTNMASTAWVTSGGGSKSGLALNFDGVSGVVIIPQPQYVYPATVNFWVRVTTFHNAYVVVLTNGATTDASFGFVSNAQDLRLVGSNLNNGNLSVTVLANWTMLSYVLANQTSRSMFINGSPNGTFTASATLPTMNSVRFGGGDFGSRKLNGLSDDLRIYNRVLSPTEIRQLYIGGRGFGLLPERPRRRGTAAAAAAFKSFWARRQSQLIGGGL